MELIPSTIVIRAEDKKAAHNPRLTQSGDDLFLDGLSCILT
jgi:hypothetical protein